MRQELANTLEFGEASRPEMLRFPPGTRRPYVFASFVLFSLPRFGQDGRPVGEHQQTQKAWTRMNENLRRHLHVNRFCPYLTYGVHALRMTRESSHLVRGETSDAVLMLLAKQRSHQELPPAYLDEQTEQAVDPRQDAYYEGHAPPPYQLLAPGEPSSA